MVPKKLLCPSRSLWRRS